MTWNVQPEPGDEAERAALLAALEQALAEEGAGAGYASPWWRSGFDDWGLGGSSASEQSGREPGIVEP